MQILLNFSNANANTFIFFKCKCKYFSKEFQILFLILLNTLTGLPSQEKIEIILKIRSFINYNDHTFNYMIKHNYNSDEK